MGSDHFFLGGTTENFRVLDIPTVHCKFFLMVRTKSLGF